MKVVAASCANLRDVAPQPVWADIQAQQPDVLLLLGDTVYLEHDDHTDPAALAAELQALYARQMAEPSFKALLADVRQRGGQVLSIYDDHDFLGDNRCGADVPLPLREAARRAWTHALAPERLGLEAYGAHRAGPVEVIVLDTQFHRHAPGTPVAGKEADAVLGAAQWQWFEQQVRTCTQPYLLVASSMTVHAYGGACWEHHPAAFQRLRALLQGRSGALVVSGDAHRNAVYDESGVIEIVTSGVAQRSRAFGCERRNYGVLCFHLAEVTVALHSLKVGSRFAFSIPLANWQLT